MPCGRTLAIKEKKSDPETDERGQFWRATMLDLDSRLRVARGSAKTETLASSEVFQTLKRRGHPDGPPPTIADGWGGLDEAMVDVYGMVPAYGGRGRPPPQKQAQAAGQYLHMVKQRADHGKVQAVKLRVVFGNKAEGLALVGKSTAYIARSHLTSRLCNGRPARKTLAFSKQVAEYRAAAIWEDSYYNLVCPHKSWRVPLQEALPQKWMRRTPAMAAKLTDHIWTVKELLTTLPIPRALNT
jgi:hypothetical protein